MEKNTLYIYTDASVKPFRKGYSFIAFSQDFFLFFKAQIDNNQIITPEDAELFSVVQALKISENYFNCKTLLVMNDNKRVVNNFISKNFPDHQLFMWQEIQALKREKRIILKWIKRKKVPLAKLVDKQSKKGKEFLIYGNIQELKKQVEIQLQSEYFKVLHSKVPLKKKRKKLKSISSTLRYLENDFKRKHYQRLLKTIVEQLLKT